MRQKKATVGTLLIAVILVGALSVYGCKRATEEQPGEGQNQQEHMEGEDGHEGHAHQGDEATPEDAEPTGEMQDGVRVIELTAEQFKFTPEQVVVNKGETVRLQLSSKDVTHGIAIEAFDVDHKIEPDQPSTVEFTADQAGTFHFHCSVYCGEGHNDMHGQLIVREQ